MEIVNGHTVWKWPETQLFLERLGVDASAPIRKLTIELGMDEIVTINQEYLGQDTNHE